MSAIKEKTVLGKDRLVLMKSLDVITTSCDFPPNDDSKSKSVTKNELTNMFLQAASFGTNRVAIPSRVCFFTSLKFLINLMCPFINI